MEINHRWLFSHDYALVDRTLSSDKLDRFKLHTVVPTGMGGQEHLMPALLCLSELSLEERAHFLELIETEVLIAPRPILCALLKCRHTLPEASQQIARQLTVTVEARQSFFRFFDPRVFRHLDWILSDVQIAHLLGIIHQWTYWNETSWRTLERPQVDFTRMTCRYFSTDQWLNISRIGLINRVFLELKAGSPPIDIEASEVNRALKDAFGFGLTESEDVVLFTSHILQGGAHFATHPFVTKILARVKREEVSYRDAVAEDWDDNTLSLIASNNRNLEVNRV